MKGIDSIVFLRCNKDFEIELRNGSNRTFTVALNFSTRLFYEILALTCALEKTEITDNEKVYTINDITAKLLHTPIEWVMENIKIENQLSLIEMVSNSLMELLDRDYFKIPDIQIEKEKPNSKNKEATKRYEKQNEIERLSKILKKKDSVCFMEEIALILTKTHNTYTEVMAMPILTFKDLEKTIILNELRSDTDYNLAYLKDRANRLQKDLNNGEELEIVTKPSAPKKQGANIMDFLIEI